MPVVIDASAGTVTGISAGGLPDGVIQFADLAVGTGAFKIANFQEDTSTSESGSSAIDTWTDTDLSLTITPTSTSSKVLVSCFSSFMLMIASEGQAFGRVRILRTVGGSDTSVAENHRGYGGEDDNDNAAFGVGIMRIDSPATTSAITYKVQMYLNSQGEGDYMTFNWNAYGQTAPPGILQAWEII